jgi:hypothetical protein
MWWVTARPTKNGMVARNPNSSPFLKPRSKPSSAKIFLKFFPSENGDRQQAKKNLQRSLDPFRYIKGMAAVEMAVRRDAHQPCLRVIKNVEHGQNKNGVQQAVALCCQARTPDVKIRQVAVIVQ